MRIPQQPAGWVPLWARTAVFYHIYPLGFLDAPSTNDRQSEPQPRLADLRRWYDHLQELGITAIYFGPLFESHSHGYDTIDYFRIDRRLGTNQLFKDIVAELHGRGIRVIIDGVFNHTGRDFFAFKDLREKGRDSAHADWYHVNWGADSRYHDGFAYESWHGHQGLPELNLTNPEVRKYLFEASRLWLGDIGVDGWRLDVAYEIDVDFWWEFRRVCKEINPECFLLGELVHGDYRKWVAPDLLDAATNYQLYKAIWSSLNDRNYWELKAVMDRARHVEIGLYNNIALLNFIGNHDVTRILSLLDDPHTIYPALIFLLTAPGIPCLYYGDEVGMTGRKGDGDRALRPPMPGPDDLWPDTEHVLFSTTARLAAIRNAHPSLSLGRYAGFDATETSFCFLRQHSREVAVVALNSGTELAALTVRVGSEGIPEGTTFYDALEEGGPAYVVTGGSLTIDPVHPGWGRILISGG